MRVLNIVIIAALILAASYVYKIKFELTLQAEKIAKIGGEIRRERDAIAVLRAEWAKLETPGRLEALARRHLALKPVEAWQFDNFERLPDRPPPPQPAADPIGAMLAPHAAAPDAGQSAAQAVAPLEATGSIAPKAAAQ